MALGWNELAHTISVLITPVKKFIVQTRVACTIKFYDHNDSAIVIYDLNDSGQFYKTMITAKASLNWDCKLPL
jgi:hypothetical protein